MYSEDLLKAAQAANVVIMERVEDGDPGQPVNVLPSLRRFGAGHFRSGRNTCCPMQDAGLPVRYTLCTTWLVGMEENYEEPFLAFVWSPMDAFWQDRDGELPRLLTDMRDMTNHYAWEPNVPRNGAARMPQALHTYFMGNELADAFDVFVRLLAGPPWEGQVEHRNGIVDLSQWFDFEDLYFDEEEPKEFAFVTYPSPTKGTYWNPQRPVYAWNSWHGPDWVTQHPELWELALRMPADINTHRRAKSWSQRMQFGTTGPAEPWRRLEI